jgi:hypothetical protein
VVERLRQNVGRRSTVRCQGNGKVQVLDRLWTDDLLVNSPLNLVNDKPRTLALLEAGRIRHTSLTSEMEHMARHNDIVDVVRREPATRTNGAEPAK